MTPAPPVWRHRAERAVVHARCTTVADGDFHLERAGVALAHRRAAVASGRWTQLDEVHGTDVVVVTSPGEHDGRVGDAAVTTCADAVLAVWVGDCVPLVLAHHSGAIGVAHAGWRGMLAGVVEATIASLRALAGPGEIAAWIGPCIHPCCYEFGAADLAEVVAVRGEVGARTSWGTTSLDMPAAVSSALAAAGVSAPEVDPACTACDTRFFSHRRGDRGRQVVVARTMSDR